MNARRLKQWRDANRRYRAKFKARGLTTRGTVRKVVLNPTPEHRRKKARAARRRLILKRFERGLTTRGSVRVYRRWESPGLPRWERARLDRAAGTMNALERAWRSERAAIGDVTIPEPNATSSKLRHDYT